VNKNKQTNKQKQKRSKKQSGICTPLWYSTQKLDCVGCKVRVYISASSRVTWQDLALSWSHTWHR